MALAAQVIVANCCFPGGVTAASRVVSWQHGLLLQKIRGWYVKKLDTKLMGQGFPWESHIKPLPFPCCTLTTNSQVRSNNPSSILLWGFFFSTNCCLDGEERKWIGGWLVCETITLYYQPTCWGPKQGTLNQVWWFNVLFVYGQKLTSGMCAHPCPHLSPCWHKCDWLFELFWDVGGWRRNCCILAAGTVCKEGKAAVCVINAAVGSRVSC